MTEIMKASEERNTVSALFLDIKSGYDNVLCVTLMDRFKAVGLSGNLLALTFNLLSSRELEANYGWLDIKDGTYKDLPEGSVLSPILYSIHMAGLKSKINQNCKLLEYATMWQSIQLPDIAVLAYRSGKEYTKYSSLFKGTWLGDST
jgi:hypothetical protein